MTYIKKFLGSLLVMAFILAITPGVFAAQYRVDDLKFSIDLSDRWTVATRTDFDKDFIKTRFKKTADDWQTFMKTYHYFLFASDTGSKKKQYDIYVSSYDEFNETIDYSESYLFELELTAKASYKANVEDKNATTVYSDYKVVKGKETKYIVFNYTDVDKDGNPMYGRLYHTVMNGYAIDFDLSAYEELSDEYVKEFNEAVLSINYDTPTANDAPWYELTARTRMNLTYLALAVLLIALIVVIIIFIVSKVKENKKFKRAAEEALAAEAQAKEDAEAEDMFDEYEQSDDMQDAEDDPEAQE